MFEVGLRYSFLVYVSAFGEPQNCSRTLQAESSPTMEQSLLIFDLNV
jgi:hypothetical protein